LPPFEEQILEGLKSGKLSEKQMETFIDSGTFKRENLEKIIEYIEKFKNKS